MANPELGSKQICPSCQAKFYDLGRRPAVCPKCQNEFDPDEAVRSRRTRVRAVAPEAEEEREDQVVAGAADEEEEEDVGAPELDEGVDEDPVLVTDDDDDVEPGVGPAAPEDELAGFSEEEEVLDDEDADVPFLEDDDDDEFDESEIDGLPGDDDDR